MLTHKQVQEVHSLLGQGLSRNETAAIVGVSRRSVYRIERDLHRPQEQRPERCPECGNYVLLPCRICASRQAKRSAPLSPGADPLSLDWEKEFGLDLHREELERYKEVRRKVEKEIVAGTRQALYAHDLVLPN